MSVASARPRPAAKNGSREKVAAKVWVVGQFLIDSKGQTLRPMFWLRKASISRRELAVAAEGGCLKASHANKVQI